MTAALEQVQVASPRAPLYRSPRGLLWFQAEPVAEAYVQDGVIVEFGTGTGKTHVAMALAALLFEDDLVDVVLMVGEKGKVGDFSRDDFPRFTGLTVGAYHGPKRAQLLADPPEVLCTSYETARNDICKLAGRRVVSDGPLTEFLRGKRVLVVFDEVVIKLRNRSAQTYRAWDYLINRVLRRHCPFVRVVGMTAYTLESHPEDHFNLGRIIRPELVGTVASFEADHVKSWWKDAPGGPRPSAYKNISTSDHEDPGVVPLSQKVAPAIFRRSKDDPEIARLFPRMDERAPTAVELSARHRRFLDAVYDVCAEQEAGDGETWGLVRMAAGHPLGLARSQGRVARLIAQAVGEDGLREIGSAKVDRLLEWARRLGDDQGVIFTFYGQTVLPVLAELLQGAGHKVAVNHGQLSVRERQEAKDSFTSGRAQFFLSSDAGCRGLNLGCGLAVVEYEPALTYNTHRQRCDRIHRLDSVHASVVADTLFALGTPDEDALDNQLQRHEWTEQLREEDYRDDDEPGAGLTSRMRRHALARAKALR